MKEDKFLELREKTTAAQKKLKIAIANPEYNEDVMRAIYAELEYMYSQMMQEVSYLYNSLYNFTHEHLKGHLPPIKSPSAMEGALNALGIGEDYEVRKPTISVAKTKKGVELNVIYKK